MKAAVVQLSASTRAIVAYFPSSKVSSLTFVRGREAFVLNDVEAVKLGAALQSGSPFREPDVERAGVPK